MLQTAYYGGYFSLEQALASQKLVMEHIRCFVMLIERLPILITIHLSN